MSEITSPIRSLLKNNVQFQWLPEHSLAFDKIKEVMMSDPVLQFYDPNKAVTIQCDASKSGLGPLFCRKDGELHMHRGH